MSKKTYKIRISPDRVLGPLTLERVEALVMKGRIQGEEPTAVEPFADWLPFTAFTELSEFLLKKLEQDSKRDRKGHNKDEPLAAIEAAADPIEPSAERTKTLIRGSDDPPPESTGTFGMPTLFDIKKIDIAEENPDLEKTRINFPALRSSTELSDEATKLLTPALRENALLPFIPQENQEDAPNERENPTGTKRLMSRNVAALLALAMLMMTVWQLQDEEEADPRNLLPRFHKFPYIEVNVPPRLGMTADVGLSADLTEKGSALLARESPSAYIRAMRNFFYPAVGKNPKNTDAKALLASCYMRMSETVPRNKRLFETIEKLLLPGPPQGLWTPEYVVAKAEYFQMLNRYDQAQEILDAYLKVRPTPEVIYQKAKVAYERRELDTALNMISKAIPPEKVQPANPRHLLLYASLLDKKGQKDAALQNLRRLNTEHPTYGPGLLFYTDFLLRNGKPKEALLKLQLLINNPALLEGPQRAEAFVVAAKTFEALHFMPRALTFARAAFRTHYNREEVEELLYRIKSKIPATSSQYTHILQARQKEKSKQLDLAVNSYIQAVERDRQDPTPFLLLARLYEEKGDVPEAMDRYKKALDTPVKPIEASLRLARIYASRFQLEEAKEMLNRASQVISGSPQLKNKSDNVNFLKGILHLKHKRPDLAEPMFELALEKGSRNVDLYIQMGEMETERKNEKLAEFYYSIALRYDPYNPKAMLGVALTRFHLDSPSRAISFLRDRLNAQPNSASIMTNLAIIYLRSGDQLSGKNYLQNAIRSDARYAEAFHLLGDLTKDEGNRQSDYAAKRHSYRYALASYEMYSKLAPNDPEGFKATADLYFDIRDLGAAAKNYHRVLDLTPNYPDVRLRLAQISRNGGDGEQAMKWLEEEIRISPKSDAALVEKGNIFMAKAGPPVPKGSPEWVHFLQQATKSFTEAAKINEKNADALFGLGVVYHLQGSYDNALSLFNRVIKLDPLKADVYWQMGLIYQRMNNRMKAIQAFTNYKGIVREPLAAGKADEKIRDLQR